MAGKKTHFICSAILILLTASIWRMIYLAQFLEYDDNYGNLLTAFFLSLGATFVLAVLWFKWTQVIKTCKWETILFLIISSPASVAIVCINYPAVFGATLKN